ncbi:MAG: hypothetical protein KQJ78_00780 [Deltaproteobacteria bacterium]|nr:hypothetical protein [Deltaproteobacteria bacterium]
MTIFWRPGCPHCAAEKEFLHGLAAADPRLTVREINIFTPEGRPLFDALTKRFATPRVAPLTVIGREVVVGFDNPAGTGVQISELLTRPDAGLTLEEVLASRAESEPTLAATPATPAAPTAAPQPVAQAATPAPASPATAPSSLLPANLRYLEVPGWGRVDLAQLTLPVLSLLLGLVDGFNPCAMWVLVAFLTALSQAGSLRRMVQFAGVFILAQGVMYQIILNSWYLAFDFIQADRIVTPIIGLVAVGAGCFFLWEAWRSDGTCKVTSYESRSRTLTRLRGLAQKSFTFTVFLGILGVAFSVNVVEFACSIGIPQTYTKILDLNQVGLLERELLMTLYVFFYMLDDLAVFAVAIYSIDRIGLTTRYSRLSNLVGGLVMLALGAILLVKPELLRF